MSFIFFQFFFFMSSEEAGWKFDRVWNSGLVTWTCKDHQTSRTQWWVVGWSKVTSGWTILLYMTRVSSGFFPGNTRHRFTSGPNEVFGVKCDITTTNVTVHLPSKSSIYHLSYFSFRTLDSSDPLLNKGALNGRPGSRQLCHFLWLTS